MLNIYYLLDKSGFWTLCDALKNKTKKKLDLLLLTCGQQKVCGTCFVSEMTVCNLSPLRLINVIRSPQVVHSSCQHLSL